MSFTKRYRRAFHGTSRAALDSILKDGLVPAGSPGADQWANGQGRHFETGRGVFLSPVAGIAATFSQMAAQVRAKLVGPKLIPGGVVLEIDLSQADARKLEDDDAFDMFGDSEQYALVYHGKIPPSWIKSYCEVIPVGDTLPRLTTENFVNPPLKLGDPVKV